MSKRAPEWYIKNKLKVPQYFFDWCLAQIPKYEWSNKERTIVSSDHKANYTHKKRLTKRTNLNFFDGFKSFAIVLVTSTRIEIQSYGYWSRIVDGKQCIERELTNFERYSEGEHVKVTTSYDEQYRFGLTSNFGSMGGAYTYTEFYHNDWQERVMSVSELRYLNFAHGINPYVLDNIYKYKDEIEFLQKIGARKLADDVMYPKYDYSYLGDVYKTVDMRTITKKWLRENKAFFKNSDRDFMTYELERRIKMRNGKLVPGIEQYLTYRDISKIPKGVGMIRFQNWMLRNDVNFKYYLDYLGLLKDLNIDPTDNENLIIPKDLQKAHDNAVNLLNQIKEEERLKKLEEEQRRLKQRKKILKKLEMVIGHFAFMIPNESKDLIREGKELSHCVGSAGYVKSHAEGKTTIVFVRDVAAKEQSLYTLEYKNGTIVQLRGKHNQTAPEEVQDIANQWLDKVIKIQKKVGAL
ncbi:PcfJ domain-containing protein [Aerococcaceae bacterium NML191219]|nr:PcfJ domain-containing protein [Aerococcaceae bacterium NML191219]